MSLYLFNNILNDHATRIRNNINEYHRSSGGVLYNNCIV